MIYSPLWLWVVKFDSEHTFIIRTVSIGPIIYNTCACIVAMQFGLSEWVLDIQPLLSHHFITKLVSGSHFWFRASLCGFNTSYMSHWWYYIYVHGCSAFQKVVVEFDRPTVRIDIIGKMSFSPNLKGHNFLIRYLNDSPFVPVIRFSSILQLLCSIKTQFMLFVGQNCVRSKLIGELWSYQNAIVDFGKLLYFMHFWH